MKASPNAQSLMPFAAGPCWWNVHVSGPGHSVIGIYARDEAHARAHMRAFFPTFTIHELEPQQ